ncbi:MAG: adenylosuccinate synthetase [Candidatus Woesearchaeota archaeon]
MVDCLVGLQWGSEGKGKIASYLSCEYNAMVRSGGPQAGHTFYKDGERLVNRQLPCGLNNLLYIASNSLINLDVLVEELVRYELYPDRVMVDNHAMVIRDEHREKEQELSRLISSTGEGVGSAQVAKLMREGRLFDSYAIEDPELYLYCGDTVEMIHRQISLGHNILIEGTQGFGLSLNHGTYPYVTSRDVTASSLLSDAGIPPDYHTGTIGVLRTYPIRVAGNSGPTESEEISWEEIARRSGYSHVPSEYTTVTGRLRRVFEQNIDELKRAVMVNRPSQLALTFIDYVNYEDYGKVDIGSLSGKSRSYIDWIEDELEVPVTFVGTGEESIIDLREGRVRAEMVEMFPDFYGKGWENAARFIERKLDHKPRIFR